MYAKKHLFSIYLQAREKNVNKPECLTFSFFLSQIEESLGLVLLYLLISLYNMLSMMNEVLSSVPVALTEVMCV